MGGHYIHTWCPYGSVLPKNNIALQCYRQGLLKKIRSMTDTMLDNNENQAVAYWVNLNSPDLYYLFVCLL